MFFVHLIKINYVGIFDLQCYVVLYFLESLSISAVNNWQHMWRKLYPTQFSVEHTELVKISLIFHQFKVKLHTHTLTHTHTVLRSHLRMQASIEIGNQFTYTSCNTRLFLEKEQIHLDFPCERNRLIMDNIRERGSDGSLA